MTKSIVDVLWVASPKVVAGAGQVLTNLLLVRALGPARSGVVFVCITAILLSDAVLGAAVDVAVVRFATDPDDDARPRVLEVQKAALAAKAIGCLLLGVPVVLWAPALSNLLLHDAGGSSLLVLSVISLFALLVLRSAQTFFQISGRFKWYGAADLLHSAVRYGGIAVFLAAGSVTPPIVLTLYAVAPLSVAVVFFLASCARSVVLAPFSGAALRRLIGLVKWYLGAAAISSINSRMDILLLSALAGTAAAGLFSAAQVCVMPFQLFGMYLAVVFAPRILPLWESGQLPPVYFRFQLWTAAAAAVVYAIVFFTVEPLAARLLPASYAGAAGIVLLLLPSSLAALVNFPWTVSFLMFTHPRFLFVMEICAFPVLCVVYRWVVTGHGAAGAAAVTSGYALFKTAVFQVLAGRSVLRGAARTPCDGIAVLPHGIRGAVVQRPERLVAMRSRFQKHSLIVAAAWVAAGVLMGIARPMPAAAVAAQGPTPNAPAALPPPLPATLYRLSPGDVIDVRLFYNPELNEQAQIRPDGHISLPLIGDVEIAGKTIPDAVTIVERRYAPEIRTPKVVIQVRTFAGQKVYVTGEVVRPGIINLPGTMTVFDAINEAGGIRATGSRNVAILIRKGDDGLPKGYRLALARGGALTDAASTLLGPFDVVMVPESKIARVDRWVDQNIRQLIPLTLGVGFSYVITNRTGGGAVVPIF